MNKNHKKNDFVEYLPDWYKRRIERKKRWRLIKKIAIFCTVIASGVVIFLIMSGALSDSMNQQPVVLLAPIDTSQETSLLSIPVSAQPEIIPAATTIRATQTVSKKIPSAQFTANTTQGSAPLTVQFTDQSVSAGTTSYTWDMDNDGVVDYTTKNPAHTYQKAGTYTVKLTVTDANGSDSEIKTSYIKILSPITTFPAAQFTANTTQGSAPLTVQFTDQSVSAGTTSYTWDMDNDGVVDYTTKNPAHTYQKAGTYTVKLTVTDANGSDSEIKTSYITLSPLQSGECFGAETCNPTGNPIGGGAGYTSIITETDSRVKYVVTTRDQLVTALKSAKSGEVVFVPSSATIDLTGASTVTIPAGVILASDRGYKGSTGGLIKRDNSGSTPLATFMIGGDNVRITGLRIQGPHSGYGASYSNVKCAIMEENRNGLEVDNCEIYYWSYAGVAFENTMNSAWSGHVHHNTIHHIAGEGYGYGVMVAYGDVLIEANTFDYTRHAVIGEGCPGEKFEFRYNHYGKNSMNPVLDCHRDCGGWRSAGGVSGRLYLVHHNTIEYAGSVAYNLYGTPSQGAYINNNIFPTRVQALNGWTRIYLTNNYFGGELKASGQ